MIDERTEELASLYAFGLLEGAELAAFESELAHNAELRALVADLRAAATTLAFGAPSTAPSPELKARVLRISARQKIVPFALPAWIPWAVAACFAFTAVWLARLYLANRSETMSLHEQIELARIEAQSAKNLIQAERLLSSRQIADLQTQLKSNDDLARLKIARLVSLNGNSPQAIAIAVWDPTQQEGMLTVEKLPALASDQDYQLWVVDPRYPNPVSGGVFTVDPQTGRCCMSFHPDRPVATAARFAISRERKGGVTKAQGPIVLLSE
ncbi:MAG: anti-sigma factor [Verrucomicrobiota bacterium]|nr:anti-sigma factor [Verrucomicrobiota bacterium]